MKLTLGSILIALAVAVPALAAKPPPGWTVAKAEAQINTKVRLPWCRAIPSYPRTGPCPGPAPAASDVVSGPFTPPNLRCMGSKPGARPSLYVRFVCEWHTVNDFGRGRVEVFVTGPSTFRWRSA